MAKKQIRVTNVIKSPAKKQVVLSTGNMLYLVSEKVLAAQGCFDPFSLRGKTVGIETFEPGEQLLNGDAYEQREDTTLIKSITSMPGFEQMSQQEVMFSAMKAGFADFMRASMGAVPTQPVVAAEPARAVEAGAAEEIAAPAEVQPGEAPAVEAPAAEVVNEELPE